MTAPVVADLDEEGLLARIVPLLGPARALVGNGDDSAVLAAPDGRFTVSTDVLVEDEHFRAVWSSGFDVGWRAAMQNVADAAAMGARARHIVVALVLPGATPVAWVEDLARGLRAACERQGVDVVGGDLSAGPTRVIAVTVHGDLEGQAAVRRDGASSGDLVAYTGLRGWSAAGLALLTAGIEPDTVLHGPRLVGAYLRPEPPAVLGALAAVAGASAMIDVSDGLLLDAERLARASGVDLDLVNPLLAFPDDVAMLTAAAERLDVNVREWLLAGGEDHGLLATFPPGVRIPDGFRPVGTARSLAAYRGRVLIDGIVPVRSAGGWDHFAAE